MDIKSTMAGTVLSIEIQLEDKVEENQIVLKLESMKMEIPIESTGNGVVKEIMVQVGDFVNEGDTLLKLKV
ncbi:acetyl-CoA carboxylase [Bacillus coahuilensis m2-6]|uniref:Acetyl-CoA carboxylase n=1 Tax=Bacillus coahuilensis p1.1.43 TaxID=1150625 RepID=A0A147K9X7_9BACI|nr:acetyl-CoA carboxylase biotin carboxyl carrier protein subunit [Bacillus coahuilensis]KUP07331.1 acetyl-CoA carboxylase [Bacillus coahuilensis p1.1.43]KUP08562.1 acetyl-CoA carboxylase [Bacillus coahuilensis m2-6]